jgi:hypothetical protein
MSWSFPVRRLAILLAVTIAYGSAVAAGPKSGNPTLDFWDAMESLLAEEKKARTPEFDKEGDFSLYNYLHARVDAHAKAAADIEKLLAEEKVDEVVAAHAEKVIEWHSDGARNAKRAIELLMERPIPKEVPPRNWPNDQVQHDMERALLLDKHRAVEAYLKSLYPGDRWSKKQ